MNDTNSDIQGSIDAINGVMADIKDSKLDEAAQKVIVFVLEGGGLEIQCVDKKLLVDTGAETLLEYVFPGCEWKFRSLLGRLCEVAREAPRESFLGNTNGFTADVSLLKGVDKVFRIQTKNIVEEQLYLLIQRVDYEEPDFESGEEDLPVEAGLEEGGEPPAALEGEETVPGTETEPNVEDAKSEPHAEHPEEKPAVPVHPAPEPSSEEDSKTAAV